MALTIIHSETYKLHNPMFEIWPGGHMPPYYESPQRVEVILAALRSTDWAEVCAPDEATLDPILAVHAPDYVAFIRDGFQKWIAADPPRREDVPPTCYPSSFPPPRWRRAGGQPTVPTEAYGYYTFDLTAPLVEGTYEAALGSARCAITAAKLIMNGTPTVYALCRPPGHHAGKDFSGGYCYFSNAAIAARLLSARGRVAIIDIDYHHGNGTQDIFWEDAQVLTISIHTDPSFDYPYFVGYADEIGIGAGEGCNLNLPLPLRTDGEAYLSALDQAIGRMKTFEPWAVVVAAGFDTFEADPICKFALKTADYTSIAQRIKSIGLPTMIVQEGGYNLEALGRNALAFLEPFAS